MSYAEGTGTTVPLWDKAQIGEQHRWLQKLFVFSCLWTAVRVGGTLTWSGCLQPAWVMLTIAYEPLCPKGRTPLTHCSWPPLHSLQVESRAEARSPSQRDVNDPVKTVLDIFLWKLTGLQSCWRPRPPYIHVSLAFPFTGNTESGSVSRTEALQENTSGRAEHLSNYITNICFP